MRRRAITLGGGTVSLMVVLFAGYAAFHSPLREPIWRLLWGDCADACFQADLGSPVMRAMTALWLVATASLAAIIPARGLAQGALERLVAWGLCSYAFVAIPAAIVGLTGDRLGIGLLRPPLGPILASVPAVAAIGWSVRRTGMPSWPRVVFDRRLPPVVLALAVLVGASIVLQLGVAIRYPVGGYDELGYHAPLAVLFWHDGGIGSFLGRFADTPVLSHPGGTELWQGLLLLIGGEPLAVAGQLPFALLGAAGVALLARRAGLRDGAAALAALIFLAAPMVMEQTGQLRNDLVAASLIACVAALLADRTPGTLPSRIILGCLGIGLLAITKLAALPAAGAFALVIAWRIAAHRRAGRPMDGVAAGLAAGVGIALLAVAPWWIRNLLATGNPLYPLDLPLIGGGIAWSGPPSSRFVPSPLAWPLYPLLERYDLANGFGGAFAVGIIPGVLAAVFIARRRAVAIAGLVTVLLLPSLVVFRHQEPRFALGLVAMGCALIPFGLVALRGRARRVAMALLVAATVVTLGAQAIAFRPPGTVERIAYYDDWGNDPVADALPERDGLLLDDRCGANQRLFPWFGAGHTRSVARIACDGATTEGVVDTMRRYGLSYVELVATASLRAQRLALYPPDHFTIVSESTTGVGGRQVRLLLHWDGTAPDPAGGTVPPASPVPSPEAAPGG